MHNVVRKFLATLSSALLLVIGLAAPAKANVSEPAFEMVIKVQALRLPLLIKE
jgi:hypothetical protein